MHLRDIFEGTWTGLCLEYHVNTKELFHPITPRRPRFLVYKMVPKTHEVLVRLEKNGIGPASELLGEQLYLHVRVTQSMCSFPAQKLTHVHDVSHMLVRVEIYCFYKMF